VISAMLGLAPLACLSHYTFPNMITRGNVSAEWQYVRMTTNHYNSAPIDDPMSPAIRCYEDPKRQKAAVATVAAGSMIGFRSSNTMGHPGPVLFYMAKVPSGQSIADFKGEGNVWFKIYHKGATTDATGVHFETGMTKLSAKIPEAVPEGEYLVRVEHIAIHKANSPQHYVACGQVKITGGKSGKPGPLVSFPGAYRKTDPGLGYNMYGSPVKPYIIPGPAVWNG